MNRQDQKTNKPIISDELLDAACDWFAKLQSDQLSDADRKAFAKWLRADQLHQLAYDKIEQMWQQPLALSAQLSFPSSPRKIGLVSADKHRWMWLAVPVAMLVLTVFGVSTLLAPNYKTGPGEQKTIFLEDGSVIHLNTNSALHVSLTANQRRLSLDYGEALFEVTHDAKRPFTVTTGDLSVTAIGTAFNIYRKCSETEDTLITVVDGTVSVQEQSHAGNHSKPLLQTSEQLHYVRGNGLQHIKTINTLPVVAWKQQKLVYDGTPLVHVLEEINRYTHDRIVLGDPKLGNIPVSAVFKIQDQETMLRSLQEAFGLKALRVSETVIMLEKARG